MSNPALLATYFFHDPAAAEGLVEAFTRPEAGLALAPVADGEWRNIQEKVRLWHGRLPGMIEGSVVQLVLNAPEPAPRGWQILREQLLRAAGDVLVALTEGLWGYTLLYQAAVAPGETEAAAEGVQSIPPGPWDGALASDTPHGQLWLLATPQGNGADARAVYAIVGPADREKELAQDWTWAPGGRWLILEMALHRAQNQRRQYQTVAPTVVGAVEKMWATTHRLLTDPHGVTAAGGEGAELQVLAERYGRLSIAASDLRLLHRTLAIQIDNARRAAIDLDLADALPVRHQLALLREADAQVGHDIGYARDTLEAAESALALVGARFGEREARAQERRNMIIAFLGLILAVGQLITDVEARSFLAWTATVSRWVPAGPYTGGQVFVTRLILAMLIGLVGMVIVWGIGKLRHGPALD